MGEKIWTAETIAPSKGSPITTLQGGELRQHRLKPALGTGQPALRAGSQSVKYAAILAITEPCSQLIWTAMSCFSLMICFRRINSRDRPGGGLVSSSWSR